MRIQNLAALVAAVLPTSITGSDVNREGSSFLRKLGRSLQNRVDSINQTGVDCSFGPPVNSSIPTAFNLVQFYYAVETTTPLTSTQLAVIDQSLFIAISGAILWCNQMKNQVNVTGSSRLLSDAIYDNSACKSPIGRKRHFCSSMQSLNTLHLAPDTVVEFTRSSRERALAVEEAARRLKIVAVSSAPPDLILPGGKREDIILRHVFNWFSGFVAHQSIN